MKIEIDAPEARDEEDVSDVLKGVAKMIRDGFTSGISMPPGVHWNLSGDYAEPEEEETDQELHAAGICREGCEFCAEEEHEA